MIKLVLLALFVLFLISIYIWYYPEDLVKYHVSRIKFKTVKKKHLLTDPDWFYVLRYQAFMFFSCSMSFMLFGLPETIITGIFSILTFGYYYTLDSRSQYTKTSTFKTLAFLQFTYFIISILLILKVL